MQLPISNDDPYKVAGAQFAMGISQRLYFQGFIAIVIAKVKVPSQVNAMELDNTIGAIEQGFLLLQRGSRNIPNPSIKEF